MARLQILELPEGSGDDRPPFVLVLDQVDDDLAEEITRWPENIATRIGARQVLCFPGTIDIPANDTTAYLQQVAEETGAAIGKITSAYTAQTLTDERTDITRDMYRLAKWKQALADALGMDRLRDWDDIRNAAAGLRKQRDDRAAELEQLRAGEEPVTDERVAPTPGQWIWLWNRATPEKRLSMAAQILNGMAKADACFRADHEAQIARLQGEKGRRGEPFGGTPDA